MNEEQTYFNTSVGVLSRDSKSLQEAFDMFYRVMDPNGIKFDDLTRENHRRLFMLGAAVIAHKLRECAKTGDVATTALLYGELIVFLEKVGEDQDDKEVQRQTD